MLCINNYTQKYIDECRSRVAAQVSAYQTLVATARNQTATGEPPLNAAIVAFEPHFFNNMVLALDNYFVHRARALEKKDGNPLNEVRMLCNSPAFGKVRGIVQRIGELALFLGLLLAIAFAHG